MGTAFHQQNSRFVRSVISNTLRIRHIAGHRARTDEDVAPKIGSHPWLLRQPCDDAAERWRNVTFVTKQGQTWKIRIRMSEELDKLSSLVPGEGIPASLEKT
jgi:hypothetical protein